MIVTIHTIFAIAAISLGLVQGLRRKRGNSHRWIGRAWVGTMAVTALSSFLIRDLTGGFNMLHVLSAWSLIAMLLGILAARRGDYARHGIFMAFTCGGLVTAGWFAADRHFMDAPVAIHVAVLALFWGGLVRAVWPLKNMVCQSPRDDWRQFVRHQRIGG